MQDFTRILEIKYIIKLSRNKKQLSQYKKTEFTAFANSGDALWKRVCLIGYVRICNFEAQVEKLQGFCAKIDEINMKNI